MLVMKVREKRGDMVFTVSLGDDEHRAVQLVTRRGGKVYSNTEIMVGDDVLVTEVPALLYPSSPFAEDALDAVTHIIVGLVPDSRVHNVKNFDLLVQS